MTHDPRYAVLQPELQGDKPPEARDFASLEDYIFGSTVRIWEGRGLHLIRRWYGEDSIVRTPMGVTRGIEPVIAATRQTLHEFPDRRLLGEDVIGCAQVDGAIVSAKDEAATWATGAPHYSSHRIVSPMIHAGTGGFGAATGRPVRARTIADCVVVNERVVEEWLVRDHGAIVAALGGDVEEAAARHVAGLRAQGTEPATLTASNDVEGTYRTPECRDERALAFADLLRAAWAADLSAIHHGYEDGVALELYGGLTSAGREQATRHWLSLAAALPDAKFSIDHLIGRADAERPHRVAVRWTARGTHDGHGAFGAPSSAPLLVLGITHVEFARGRVHREWTLIDTLAVHRQIAAHRG